MEEKYPYGKNISALFIGPPGTGKTMAVDIISGLINLPVYKIDLSQVVDKYIGETEKKLEEVFNLAQKSNTILFFDEADSIFGKRSEVNEAKDRYANTEVSYILQRIEQYDGVVILASNFKKNIDEAFLRRMRYLVEFPMPDAATRKEIWKSCFGSKVPTEDLDFSYLAKNFEFSGGSIKNIALNAVFLAAKEGCDVGMKQVLTSLRNEKMKMGKPMILSDFGQYAGLMMEGEFR
ncbi:MAG: ATP-binding protein [Lachnospiraceae bacterium]|nr:ATP-binding protein [Lachnospiraceae bacterium]